jgi:ribonucleoside-diphosphate reductase alpha chain
MVGISDMQVRKRDGSLETLDFDKIHKMLEWCSNGLNVSVSDTAISAQIKIVNKISSADIQQTLIKSAAEKISTEFPDYDVFSGRLLVTNMRKQVYHNIKPTPFVEYIKSHVDRKLYSPTILEQYSEEEIENLGSFLDYDNDMNRGYASIIQLESKYLLKDVKTDTLLEMPQETFMIIPMVIFANENKNRTQLVIDFYTALKAVKDANPKP